jgi:hypothetical protein
MLAASNGDLWVISTPGKETGLFYEIWHTHEPDSWLRLAVPATECPRINPEFLAEARRMLGDSAFRREYLCEFVPEDGAIFTRALLDAAFDPDIEPINGGRPVWSR